MLTHAARHYTFLVRVYDVQAVRSLNQLCIHSALVMLLSIKIFQGLHKEFMRKKRIYMCNH